MVSRSKQYLPDPRSGHDHTSEAVDDSLSDRSGPNVPLAATVRARARSIEEKVYYSGQV